VPIVDAYGDVSNKVMVNAIVGVDDKKDLVCDQRMLFEVPGDGGAFAAASRISHSYGDEPGGYLSRLVAASVSDNPCIEVHMVL
jgi:hypothetical protein